MSSPFYEKNIQLLYDHGTILSLSITKRRMSLILDDEVGYPSIVLTKKTWERMKEIIDKEFEELTFEMNQ